MTSERIHILFNQSIQQSAQAGPPVQNLLGISGAPYTGQMPSLQSNNSSEVLREYVYQEWNPAKTARVFHEKSHL